MEKVVCTNCGADNTAKAKYCRDCGHELPRVQIENKVVETQDNTPPKNKSKANIIVILVGISVFLITYFTVQQYFSNSGSIDKEMMSIAADINKSCPIMLDSETRFDNAVALPGKVFQYNYTLINVEKSTADTAAMKSYLVPNITNNVKSNPQMQYQRDHKWILNYYYKDKNGLYLFLITVGPDNYLK